MGTTSGDLIQTKPPGRKLPSWLPQVMGYALSAGCLVWVLHGYDLREIQAAIKDLDWFWVSICMILDLLVYVFHGWRWQIVLGPIRKLPLWQTVQAIYIGLFANEVLPLRTGELIRCYLLAHWQTLHLSVVFASAAVERLLDGFWLLAGFLITASFLKKIPSEVVDVVRMVAALLAIGGAILIYVVMHKHHAHAVVRESRWAATLRHVIEGLHLMGHWRSMVRASGASFLYLAIQVLSAWALMKAYRLDLSLWQAAAALVVIRVGTVIPNAPGNLGLLQAACTVALTLLDVEMNVAKTFSFIMFLAWTLPLLVGGAIALALTGLNLRELRHKAKRSAESAQDVVP